MNDMNGKIIKEGYTFDDVLLVPASSAVIPSQVSLSTKLTSKIELKIPVVSAAMDTVTEAEMAIALARAGGLGFIHKNMSIERQAFLIDRVKRWESGMVSNPFTVKADDTLEKVVEYVEVYGISGLPVVDDNDHLIGIITQRDLKYCNDHSVAVRELMTKENLIIANVGITLDEAKEVLIKHKIEKLPIIDENNKLKGLITLKDIDNVDKYPDACKDENGRLRVGGAVGIGPDTLVRVDALVAAGVDIVTVDSAHGHSDGVVNMIKQIRAKHPDLQLIGGNIVTAQAAIDLMNAGVNAVKVGIGPGSICTTRVVAGVGVPQLTAVNDVVEALKGTDICVIADGGIKLSGDIVKALAAGANCVMLGSLLAGCDEAPGDEVIYNGRRFKVYVGMGSLAAMRRGSADRYFQGKEYKQNKDAKKLVPEGIEGRVPAKGPLQDTVYQLMGGLKSGMGYCGTATITELRKNARFVKITNAGLKESHPHDVEITKEAPNYSGN